VKLLVVGFDAVGWESVIPQPPPCFKALMVNHAYGKLHSTKIAHTIPALFSVYEGVDRSDELRKKNSRVEFSWDLSWNNAKHPLIFDMLSSKGVKMGLVSLPFSAPVRPYRDFVLGSWMADRNTCKTGSREIFYPLEAKKLVKNHRGCILRELGPDRYIALRNKPLKLIKLSELYARMRMENFITLSKHWKIDLGFLYFDFTDRIAHLVKADNPIMKPTINLCNELLTTVIAASKPKHILVFSDHGWGFYKPEVRHHNPTGFYIYTGRKGNPRDARIVDIAPTILKEFNVNIPPYFSGEAI